MGNPFERPQDVSEEETAEMPGNDDFYPPSDLRRIRKLPPAEKRKEFPLWKERFERYVTAHAAVQEAIIEEIRIHPHAATGDLYAIAKAAAEKGDLSYEDLPDIQRVIDTYLFKHDAIERISEEYPEDTALYERLFGSQPFGRVEVIAGPMTLYFRCYNPRDYARIRVQKFSPHAEITESDIAYANKSGGVHLWHAPIPALNGTINAENSHLYGSSEQLSFFTRRHEEQHAINQLFKDKIIDRSENETLPIYFDGYRTYSREEQILFIERYMRWIREGAEMRAKDEILAYYREGDILFRDISDTLTRPAKKGGIYDYIDTRVQADIRENLEKKLGRDHADLFRQCAKKVFVEEYRILVGKAIDAVSVLEQKYAPEQTIAILQKIPLRKWTRITATLAKETWENLQEEYNEAKEAGEVSEYDEYEKMPKRSGFGRSKQSGAY